MQSNSLDAKRQGDCFVSLGTYTDLTWASTALQRSLPRYLHREPGIHVLACIPTYLLKEL
jgi:hypothetical protein